MDFLDVFYPHICYLTYSIPPHIRHGLRRTVLRISRLRVRAAPGAQNYEYLTRGAGRLFDSTMYWGHHGLSATLSDNDDQYVQDDSPNADKEFHAGFYFDPNSLTMASGDVLDLLTGYSGTDPVLTIQLQKVDTTFKVRVRAINDNDVWSEAATWQSITDGWNNLEIDYRAADLSGRLVLRLAGVTLQSLSNLDTGSISIDSVRLGTMGVETGTRGTVFFDDYQSRRFSLIGPLPDPGLQDPQVTPVVDWINKAYSYTDEAHKHAVTSVVVTDEENTQTTNSYVYDANGRGLCTP